jgi:hypothetical protein
MNYDTKNTFTLGKHNKGDNPKRPDYRGEMIDETGRVWELSGWIRSRRSDPSKKFISGRVKLKEVRKPGPEKDESGGGFEVENEQKAGNQFLE